MQCSCPYKPVELVSTCDRCVKNIGTPPETPGQQKQRISYALAEQIRQIEARGGDHHMVGVTVFGLLVEARIEIENLKRKIQ
jgi:hypothetical protein